MRQANRKLPFRQVSAVLILSAMMLPIAAPIPAWAYSAHLPIRGDTGFRLTAPEASFADSVTGLAQKLMSSPTTFFLPFTSSGDEKTAKKKVLGIAELEKRVADIATEIVDGVEVEVGQSFPVSAVPLDTEGKVIHGVGTTWKTPNDGILRIEGDRVHAVNEGETVLEVTSGGRTKEFRVRVLPVSENDASYVLETGPVDDLTEEEYRSSFTPQENLGNPIGQVEAQSPVRGAATRRSIERPGSSSFSFEVPIAGLPGRGSDAGISMTYNSRVWSLFTYPFGLGQKYMYNQDADWMAPGFKMTLGSLRKLDYYNYSLTSPDGTKHQLHYVSGDSYARVYESADGTFIKLNITASGSVVNSPVFVSYSDGSKVTYSRQVSSSAFFYPTRITDRNGNITQIAYLQNDTSGRIAYIRDTLNRYITFHYDTGNKLVAVTVPGFNGGGDRQTIRFYYETINFDTTTQRFSGDITEHIVPASADVLRYVYFPGTQTGYEYEYSSAWGMIYKVSSLRGMEVDSPLLSTSGSVTDEGEVAASTTYNYPLALGAPLTEVPAYTTRTDDWLGRTTTQAPVTSYAVVKNTGSGRTETRITAPDGTITETWAKIAPNLWDDGLVTDTFIKTPNGVFADTVWAHTKTFWGNQPTAPGRKNIRIDKVETTNDAGDTRATSFVYDIYNNQTKITEHDFDDPGELGAELRKTEISYVTNANWVSNRLVRLPLEIKTTVDSVVVSKTKFEYDNNGGAASSYLVGRTNISSQVHDRRYNWSVGTLYESATDFRGNVTNVTLFSDATLGSDPNASITNLKYDVAGNLVETGASCCKERAWEFSVANEYAYPISVQDGDAGQLESIFSYDLNTGLLLSHTDENSQTISYTYDSDRLRVTRVDLPNGAWSTMEYNETVFPYHIKSTRSLDSSRSVSGWSFINGIGQGFRSRSQTSGGYISSDVEFDNMGRPYRSFNPYTVTNLGDARPGGVRLTEMTEFDGLGRVLETTLTDETTVVNEYSGLVATITDQAGKKRRQIADTLGRIIRVDEPNSSGELGSVSSPNQPTYYEYDGNDNLTKVLQSDGTNTQERLFKYDSLSRLTHERQVEANATLNDSGVHIGSGVWTGVYKYNTDNLLSEAFNAKGVKSAFTYDGLNRVATVTYTGESGYQTPQITYIYDETESGFYNKSHLTKVQTAAVSSGGQETPATVQNYRYDAMGQVVTHTQSIGSETYLQEYSYNLAGQLIAQKYPSGRIVENEIDNYGRLTEVADSQRTYVSGLTFNSQGMLSQINLGNGTHETFSYNDRFQMTSQSLMKDAEVLQKYEYGYGQTDVASGTVDATKNNGQLGKIESFIGANKQASQRFAYDHLGRLKEAREHRGDNDLLTYKQVFDFDRFGNKYRKAENNPTAGQANPLPFTPIEDSHISKTTNRFTSGTTYDDAGQVVNDAKFREIGFAYDANGRMVKATPTSQPDAWTVYDALGNRVGTKINDVWQLMVYDAFGKLVAEYGIAADSLGGVKFIQQDWQRSVRTVSNSNGFVMARTDHQAFGEDIGVGVGLRKVEQGYSADKATRQDYGLTENDSTGLNHTWFRKLETQAGRWSSPDPYKGSMSPGDPQSFNRYAYVGNDPINFVDPSGLDFTVVFASIELPWNGSWDGDFYRFWRDSQSRTGHSPGGGPGGGGGRGGNRPRQKQQGCPISDTTPLKGEALSMENGNTVLLHKLTGATQNALTCLQESILEVSGTGGPHYSGSTGIGGRNVSFQVESAYRPESYQRHFWEILNKLKDKRINQKSCASLKAKLLADKKKHGLGGIAAKSNSRHSNGTGVDMTWKGISASRVDQKANNCGLIRNLQHVRGEESHFTLK